MRSRRNPLTRSSLLVLAASLLTSAAATSQVKVGVIPAEPYQCPPGAEYLEIHMDDEDEGNENDRGGWIGATQSDKNTKFAFCKVDGQQFKPLAFSIADPQPAGHYAVLKLSDDCPPGSVEFTRIFDNENKNNENTSYPPSVSISPNATNDKLLQGKYAGTRLHFWLFLSLCG